VQEPATAIGTPGFDDAEAAKKREGLSQPTYRDLSDGGTSHDCRPYLRVAIGEVRVSSGAGPFEFACTIEFVVRECTLPKPV
jgi:hypothetical protein